MKHQGETPLIELHKPILM